MINLKKKIVNTFSILTLSAVFTGVSIQAEAGPNPFLGDIMIVGFNFCPRGWEIAEGQLLQINQHQSLYSLLGTQFGGDGRTTFGLPDLRGRATMGQGSGSGLSTRVAGQTGGSETKVMSESTMPNHRHLVNANNLDGDKPGPGGKLLAAAPPGGTGDETIYSTDVSTVNMAAGMISHTGASTDINTRDPFLSLRHCIATQGVFPPRD